MSRTVVNRLAHFLIGTLACLVLAGCVSSQSRSGRSEPSDDASDQNYRLGAQYYRNANYNLARSRLERAIELDDRNADAHSLLALTLAKIGNNRLATESFSRSVRLAPNNKDIRNNYAVYLCQQARYDEAIEQFDRAIAITENDSSWIEMTNAGVCVAKKPDLDTAEQYFRSALELRPAFGEALIQLSALKHRTGDNLTARAFMQRFLANHPPSAAVLYLGVQIETQLEDERAATDYMNQLLTGFPDSAEARLLLQQG
jgi:type IV pilus assembly protein PilF